MPDDSLPSKCPLPTGLHHFIHMTQTRESIEAYLATPNHADGLLPETLYRVSNVFAYPLGAPPQQIQYEIGGNHLAQGGDTLLLLSAHVDRAAVGDASIGLALHGRDADQKSVDVHKLVTGTDIAALWKTWSVEHDHAVEVACHGFNRYWTNTIFGIAYSSLYLDGHGRHKSAAAWQLSLVSRKSKPKWALAGEFCTAKETRHLIVLTAQQELSGLYDWVEDWYRRALEGTRVYRDKGLDDGQLGLLSARARGYHYWTTDATTADLDPTTRRFDAPVERLVPYCSIAAHYWDFMEWYKKVYRDVVAPFPCGGSTKAGEPCPNAARVSMKPGHPYDYCAQCSDDPDRRRAGGRERVRRYRTRQIKTRNAQ